MKRARFIITDSGGVQEEAPCLGKPLLIARESTERQETVEAGQGLLIGHNKNMLVEKSIELLTDTALYKSMAQIRYIFGDGTSSLKIVAHCIDNMSKSNR